MKSYKNIIFDFDGVLHNSPIWHLKKFNEVFNLGLTMEEYSLDHFANYNVLQKKNNIMNKVDWNIYHEHIERDFPKLIMDANIKKTILDWADSYNLFIISSGHNKHIIDFLRNNEVWNIFTKALFLEDHKLKTEKFKILEQEFSINPKNSIFVTDTIGDVLEARDVGYKSIGVTFGLHSKDLFEKVNTFKIVNSWDELKKVI